MEHPFETPHPSIQTQDQIFRLPSSKPCYSPNLSPLPIATTRSRNLKENRASTPHTPKTLDFGGRSASVHSSSLRESREPQIRTAKTYLKANMKPRLIKPRNPKSASKSGINLEWALASPFVSRASSPIDDQRSNTNPNRPPPRSRPGKRGLSDTFYNPNVPSPGFRTRITEKIHEREKERAQIAHTSPSSNVPPSVLLDLNTQLKPKRRKGGHRGTVSVDGTGAVASYFQHLGGDTITRNTHEGHQRERRTSAPSVYSRRPRSHVLPLLVAAPVGLEGSKTRRSRLASGLEIIYNVNNDAVSTGAGAFTAGAISHADDDGFVLPLLPHPHNKNITTNNNSAESEIDMNWRVGIVDFNRPPSQMCHYPTTAMLSGWCGGDVFSSSGSEGSTSESEEEDDRRFEGSQTMANPSRASRTRTRTARPLTSGFRSMFDDPFGFGSVLPDLDQSTFGDGAWGISTPLKTQIRIQAREEEKERKERKGKKMIKATSTSDLRSKNHDGGLVRVRSLPVMHAMGVVGEGWMEMNDYDQETDANEEDQDSYEQDQEQDMDLTTPLITGNIDTSGVSTALESSEVIQLVDKRGDTTPWILDSLISPPSRFLSTREGFGREHPDGEDESAQGQDDAGNLSSNSLSSFSSSEHNPLSFPFRLSSDAHIQSQPEVSTSTTAIAAATASTAKRTRSGTIVPSFHRIGNISNNTDTNDPPGTRRTRSGTLVGPLPLPLATSGSGVQLAVGNGNLSVRRNRERSGTILAGLSPVGARRTRSGIIIGCPPTFASTSVSVSVSSGKSTKERGSRPEISEKYMPTTPNPDRADEHCSGFNYDKNLDGSDVEVDTNGYTDAEPHIDALYVPRQCSSPDPIDFLRLAHFQDYDGMREKHHRFGLTIEEREDEDPDLDGGTEETIENEMEWCIADEPPSPIVIMNKSNLEVMGRRYNKRGILSVRRGGRRNNKRRRGEGNEYAKGRGKTRTKFMIDGREEQPDEFLEPEEGEDSDDELLLRDRSTSGVEAG